MLTQPSDIVSPSKTQSTDQTKGGTALVIVRSVVDQAIKVSVDDGYIPIGVGVDIIIGFNVIDACLARHKVLVCLDRWTIYNQLSRDKLCGQMIKVRCSQSMDQSIPLGGRII